MAKITRYDPNWNDSSQQMEPHSAGDYVEYYDQEKAVSDLEKEVEHLRKIVAEVFDLVRGEA